jgi:hypothetical protein
MTINPLSTIEPRLPIEPRLSHVTDFNRMSGFLPPDPSISFRQTLAKFAEAFAITTSGPVKDQSPVAPETQRDVDFKIPTFW